MNIRTIINRGKKNEAYRKTAELAGRLGSRLGWLGYANPKRYIKLLDLYIIKKFIGTYFYSIALIISISIVFDINENLAKFTQYHAPLKAIVFDYYMNFVPVNAEVLLASALASEITATTFVALEATTLVAFLETLSVALATEVTATLAVALEAAAATLVIVVIIASTATDT